MTATPFTTAEKTTWAVDPSHTDVTFTVRHLMISKVRGAFGAFTGTITTGVSLEDTKVEGSIDVTSITTNDENRDAHLRSADFFDTENHPSIQFESTGITAKKNGNYELVGDLTIKGNTKPVLLDVEFNGTVTDSYGQVKLAASAETAISRSEFGLVWNGTLETGGVVVSDEVKIQLEVQLIKQ